MSNKLFKMSIACNYKKLIQNIKFTCKEQNKNFKDIKIVAVSKKQGIKKIEALSDLGHNCFGENRLEETILKWPSFKRKNISLHFIGALQSKKVSDIVKFFDVIETLDTESSAKKLSMLQSQNIKIPKIYIQINIGEEPQKGGIEISNLESFYKKCVDEFKLDIIGLMSIPPFDNDSKPYFIKMNELSKNLNLKDISMGMSDDYMEAIKQGSTFIRVGSKIFGARS